MKEGEAMTRALEFAVSRGLEKVPDGSKILAVLQKNVAALSARHAKRDARKSWCYCGGRKGPGLREGLRRLTEESFSERGLT